MDSEAITWAYETENFPANIKGGVHSVLLALCYSLNRKTKQCNPSINRLAKLTHLKTSAVKSALTKLKRAGLISLTSGQRLRKSNSYIINFQPYKPKIKTAGMPTATPTPATTATATATTAEPIVPPPPQIDIKPNPDENYLDADNWIDKKNTAENVCCGYASAHMLVKDYFTTLTDKDLDDRINANTIQLLSEGLALFAHPTRHDVETILNKIKRQSDWCVYQNTVEAVKKQINVNKRIVINTAHYFLRSLKNNLTNDSINDDLRH